MCVLHANTQAGLLGGRQAPPTHPPTHSLPPSLHFSSLRVHTNSHCMSGAGPCHCLELVQIPAPNRDQTPEHTQFTSSPARHALHHANPVILSSLLQLHLRQATTCGLYHHNYPWHCTTIQSTSWHSLAPLPPPRQATRADMDDFDDDDLDNLNPLALQELEEHAIQFTQAAQTKPLATQRRFDFDDFEYDDLDDAVVQDDLRGPLAVSPQRVPHHYAQHAPVTVPSQHGAWGQPPSVPAQPANRLAGQIPMASRPLHSRPQPPPQAPRPAPSIPARYQASQAPPRQTASAAHELATLQAQIRDLQSRLTTKDGEIRIVRSRLEKSQQEHEREMQNLEKQSAEQLAKLQRAAEVATIAQQTAATELQFTRRDLRDELQRAKSRTTANGPTTPKKTAAAKSWGASDGFEDVEMAGSPTRGRAKHAGPVATMVAEPKGLRTPTKNKRKRPIFDSPVMELEIQSDDPGVHVEDLGNGPTAVTASAPVQAGPIANVRSHPLLYERQMSLLI